MDTVEMLVCYRGDTSKGMPGGDDPGKIFVLSVSFLVSSW